MPSLPTNTQVLHVEQLVKEIILEFSIFASFSTLTRSLPLSFGKCHICIYSFIKSLLTITFHLYKKNNFEVQLGSESVSYSYFRIRVLLKTKLDLCLVMF